MFLRAGRSEIVTWGSLGALGREDLLSLVPIKKTCQKYGFQQFLELSLWSLFISSYLSLVPKTKFTYKVIQKIKIKKSKNKNKNLILSFLISYNHMDLCVAGEQIYFQVVNYQASGHCICGRGEDETEGRR